jgi:glutamine amidotransferase
MIAVINYGLGNVQAFANIYKRLNIPVSIVDSASDLADADKVILPGVGSFDWAMTRLNESGLRTCLDDLVLAKGRPFLGVCVGMQMLADSSDEGQLPGLGWIPGQVKKFSLGNQQNGDVTYLPHMGWNDVAPVSSASLFKDMSQPEFYFLHSFYFLPEETRDTLGSTEYGRPFVSAVRRGNIFGTQFHPEKSHHWGVQLLKNFAEVC